MTPLKKEKLTVLPHLCLEELGNGSDTSKGKDSHVDADAAGGTVIVLVALGRTGTIALLATVLTLVGVLVVERALLLTINLLVILHVVEKLAELLDIGSGRNDDTAANLLKLGELDPVKVYVRKVGEQLGFQLTSRSCRGEQHHQ